MKIGDKVIVKNNLREELRKQKFCETVCESMELRLVGTISEVFGLWKSEDGQEYATIDLCYDIPVQCLDVI